MSSTRFKTWKQAPSLLDRLLGTKQGFYRTKITDGEVAAYGSGPTREASQQDAKRNWDRKLGRPVDHSLG